MRSILTMVDELEEVNQALRNRDKMKQLSDQVMALTARMREFEGNNNGCNTSDYSFLCV